MTRTFIFATILSMAFLSCKSKNEREGTIVYEVKYQLPDSLKRFAAFLPKEALVYFKNDSSVCIQKTDNESTTVILDLKANKMRVLLSSPARHYVVDYNKEDQAGEIGTLPPYAITKTTEQATIAGYRATKYIFMDKLSQDTSVAWFTKEISIPSNYLTVRQDSSLGVPLSFTINQNGMKITTVVKQLKFEPVADVHFATPTGYTKLTPQQLLEMPVDH